MTAALIQDLRHGLMADFADTEFPSRVYGVTGAPLHVDKPGTLFGFAWKSGMSVMTDGASHFVSPGHYFSLAGRSFSIVGGPGYVVHRLGYHGLNQLGGPVERVGRLRYIDGCSDTLLLAPPLRGDPCFNLLHFPKGINQTKHTHPSIRAGLIHGGSGYCHTATGTEELRAGKMFLLFPDAIHAFETVEESMNLTVFHPDSDFGPTHEEHPMLNRTIVDGVSAKHLDAIRTKTIVE